MLQPAVASLPPAKGRQRHRRAWHLEAAAAAAAAVPTPSPLPACRVAIVSLGLPRVELPGPCSNSSGLEAYLANPDNYLPMFHYVPMDRYRVGRYLVDAVAAQRAGAAVDGVERVVDPVAADVVLLDDRGYDDAYFCLSMHRSLWHDGNGDGTKDWDHYLPLYMEERAARRRAALASLLPSQRMASTWLLPVEHWNRVDVAHAQQIRLVIEMDYVPATERAGARYLVVPYAAHRLAAGVGEATAVAAAAAAAAAAALLPRPLLFLRMGCAFQPASSMGMRFRSSLIKSLNLDIAAPDVVATCTICPDCEGFGANHISVEEYLVAMARARFCPLLPGDSPSSSRLSEVMMVRGCIPIFLGPPWMLLPLLPIVDYARFALFVNLSHAPRAWLTDEDARMLETPGSDWHPEARNADLRRRLAEQATRVRAAEAGDAPPPPAMLNVESNEELLALLRAVPEARQEELLDAAEPFRHFFTASSTVGGDVSGHDIVKAVCAIP